jgi:hypothetical protein
MIFSGFTKLTLLDYPGKTAAIVFTRDCNFRCPFCHNGGLVLGRHTDTVSEEEILAAMEEGKVCILVDAVWSHVYSCVGMTSALDGNGGKLPTFAYAYYATYGKGDECRAQVRGTKVYLFSYDNMFLPNPYKLEFTGAVTGTYDGREYMRVHIPTGGSGGGSVGPQGPAGADGFSPTVTLTREADGVVITATNKDGETSEKVYDGKDGAGGGLPEGGEPHQMLVTDGEGNAKWDERTHWKEEGLIDVLPENAPMYSEDSGSFFMTERFLQKLVEGDSYTVIWNGEPYECTANKVNTEVMDILCLGNMLAMGGEDSGEPFFIEVFPDDAPVEYTGGLVAQVMPLDGSTEATIKIQYDGVVYHKLAPEFLPIPLTSGEVDVLPEITVNVDEMEDGELVWTEPIPGEVVIGETYTVNYNGKTYTCTAVAFDLSGGEGTGVVPALGNIGAVMGDESQITEEPFMFAYILPEYLEMVGAYAMLVVFEDVYEHTFGIKGAGGVKIDNSALDLDWIPKFENVGELILETAAEEQVPVILNIPLGEKVSVGDKVVVVSDGDFYNLVVKEADGVNYIGNASLNLGEDALDTGEPFFIASMGSETFIRYGVVNNDIHEIELYKAGDSQKIAKEKLPKEFLPDTSALHVVITQNDDETYSGSHTAQDIYKAFTENRPIFCSYDGAGNAIGIRVFSLVEVGKFTSVFSRFDRGEEQIFTIRSIDGFRVDYEVKEYAEGDIDSIADAVIAKIPSAEGVGF